MMTPDLTYIRCTPENGYSLVKVYVSATGLKEFETPFVGNELIRLHSIIEQKKKINQDMCKIPCWNPNCGETIIISYENKRDFLIRYFRNYGKVVFPFCSKKCRDEFETMISEEIPLTKNGELKHVEP
ncbi:hypothetical protein [Bacteroides sp.]|uniref:hypothetical protein n=1 Tax=Bacteroides sp. TaxID=29523 RepID=UPI0026186B90|nr:hypothetical protein [Bacteroides sp.]MDD3039015.1 hypothetical protein [Bacteroides sp.]